MNQINNPFLNPMNIFSISNTSLFLNYDKQYLSKRDIEDDKFILPKETKVNISDNQKNKTKAKKKLYITKKLSKLFKIIMKNKIIKESTMKMIQSGRKIIQKLLIVQLKMLY